MKLYHWKAKTVFQLKKGASDFIKAYTTNLPDSPGNAFVDIHGKIVAVCDQFFVDRDHVYIVIESKFKERLLEHLEKYLNLTGTVLEPTSLRVYFDFEGTVAAEENEKVILQKKGQMILTEKEHPSVSEEEFRRFRVENLLPVQGVDYDAEMLLNVYEEGHVSYTKGCYLGQETICKVHTRGRAPQKLIVKDEKDCSVEEKARMTSAVLDPATGRQKGFVFIRNAEGLLS